MPNPRRKEAPQHSGVPHKAHHVAHGQLRAQPPPKETKVARVAQLAVDARRDQDVLPLLGLLDDVVEGRAGLHHGRAADDLAHHDQAQPGQREERGRRHQRGPGAAGEQAVGDQALDGGGGVGDGVGGPVGRQEERGDVGLAGVVRGGGPELQEVEGGQRGEEEGEAPERGGRPDEEDEGAGDADGEGDAQAKGAEGDAGQGFGLAWEVRPVGAVGFVGGGRGGAEGGEDGVSNCRGGDVVGMAHGHDGRGGTRGVRDGQKEGGGHAGSSSGSAGEGLGVGAGVGARMLCVCVCVCVA